MTLKPTIYIVEHHHELLYLWRELGVKHIKLVHFDAHCDMHGLLVDRDNNCSYILPGLKTVDCGNFISFAVQEGLIEGIKWIYDEYGGRDKDITHVKYVTDLTVIPFLVKNYFSPAKKYPLKYKADEFSTTKSFEIEENEHLDIDWDFFALESKSSDERKKSVGFFLEYSFSRIPSYTYISYSADYITSSRKEFNDFIIQLKEKFKANVVEYSYPLPKEKEPLSLLIRYKKGLSWRLRQHLLHPFKKQLNKMGIY